MCAAPSRRRQRGNPRRAPGHASPRRPAPGAGRTTSGRRALRPPGRRRRVIGSRRMSTSRRRSACPTGRISTAPHFADGARPAQAIAASRSSTSRTKVPPSCSFVSANGPSWTRSAPSSPAAHRRRERGRLQDFGGFEDAGGVERLRVLVEFAHAFGERLGSEILGGHLGVVQQECVSHDSLFCRIGR